MKLKINFELLIVIAIVLSAAFLRLYRIPDYMTFLGDEGRDVLIAKGILEGRFTLLGPRASAGDFFLGPIYYYFMAPFLWLFRLDPVGPAVMVALIGIATVFLIYKVTREFFGLKAAVIASSLYAVSPLVVAYSRSSWNPNPMPFVSLLTLYLSYRAIENPSWKKFIGIGILLGIALQLHYLAIFLIIIVGAFLFFSKLHKGFGFNELLKRYLQIFAGFIIGFSPFLVFETRHGFPNFRTIFSFVFTTTFHTSYGDNISFINIVKDVFFRLFGRLVTNFPLPEHFYRFLGQERLLVFWQISTVVLGICSVLFIFGKKKKLTKIFFEVWLFLGVLLFGFYKKPIYDYYFGFLFPLPFILVGNFLSQVYEYKKFKYLPKLLSVGIFLVLLFINLSYNPFRYEPNRQKEQVKKISQFVFSKTDNKPFNFALITAHNSDYAYRYYFDVLGKSDVRMENPTFDPKRKTVTDQLLVVCEDVECKPLGHPLFEVSNFGRAEIVGEWNVSVVKVFKLVHYMGK